MAFTSELRLEDFFTRIICMTFSLVYGISDRQTGRQKTHAVCTVRHSEFTQVRVRDLSTGMKQYLI